jgi:hypothetical protein
LVALAVAVAQPESPSGALPSPPPADPSPKLPTLPLLLPLLPPLLLVDASPPPFPEPELEPPGAPNPPLVAVEPQATARARADPKSAKPAARDAFLMVTPPAFMAEGRHAAFMR